MYHVIKKRARVRATFAAFNAKMARAVGRGVPLIIIIGFILLNSIFSIIVDCVMDGLECILEQAFLQNVCGFIR